MFSSMNFQQCHCISLPLVAIKAAEERKIKADIIEPIHHFEHATERNDDMLFEIGRGQGSRNLGRSHTESNDK